MSYDDTQLNAVLMTCSRCGKAHYMTKPHPICVTCRDYKPAPKPSRLDVGGVEMTDP